MDLHTLLGYPAVRGALAGLVAAAVVDFAAFKAWKSFSDAYDYDWKTAGWRWFQGVVVGAVTGSGLGIFS